MCFRDTNFTRDTIPAVVKISCPYVGRYVIFYNERLPGVVYPSEYSQYTYSALCELQVYGKIYRDWFPTEFTSYFYIDLYLDVSNVVKGLNGVLLNVVMMSKTFKLT